VPSRCDHDKVLYKSTFILPYRTVFLNITITVSIQSPVYHSVFVPAAELWRTQWPEHYAVKQIIIAQFATLRQQSVSAVTENEPDMNGQSVSNGHLTVNGGQAIDQQIAGANDHFADQANGHEMGRKLSSATDTAYPMFSKTAIGQTERCSIGSATYEAKPNAEVSFMS